MSSSELTLEQSSKSFDGYQYIYSHESFTAECPMKFGVYMPSVADRECVPLLIFLSDSNCTEQNFILKSGMQRLASKYGFIVANPDTSPRTCSTEDRGCYIDGESYQMFSYINEEFYELLISNFNVDIHRIGILGHGMGGHGALISFFKCPAQYRSVSAFVPICDPSECERSRTIFRKFFGENEDLWKEYDACELVTSYSGPMPYAPVLVDRGANDESASSRAFLTACSNASFPLQLREQLGYEQDDYFLATFLEDHFKYHQKEFEHLD